MAWTRASPTLLLAMLCLLACGLCQAGIPQKLDERALIARLETNPSKKPLNREERVWTLAALGRLRIAQNRIGEAEIFFAKADVDATVAGLENLKSTVAQFALDLFARNAAAKGDWQRFDELAAGFRPYTMADGPRLVRPALALGYCMRRPETRCLRQAHSDFMRTLDSIRGLAWTEDVYVLQALARIAAERGFGIWASELQFRFASSLKLSDEEKVRMLLIGVSYGLDNGYGFDIFGVVLQQTRTIVDQWQELESKSKSRMSTQLLSVRHNLQRLLTVLETRQYLITGSPKREEVWRRIDDSHGLETIAEDDVRDVEQWTTQQFLGASGLLQSALEQATSDQLGETTAHHFDRRVYLMIQVPALASSPMGQLYARAYAASIPMDPSLRRQDARATVNILRNSGLFDEALARALLITRPLVDSAEAGGHFSAVLRSDLVGLTELALRATAPNALVAVRQLTARAAAVVQVQDDIHVLLKVQDAALVPAQIPLSERAVQEVVASPTLSADTKMRLLWSVARMQSQNQAPAVDDLLAQIETAAITLNDEFLQHVLPLIRAHLALGRRDQPGMERLIRQLTLERYAARSVPELVIAAAIIQRAGAPSKPGNTAHALCAVRGLYQQAGSPTTGWFALTPEEHAVLAYQPKPGIPALCPSQTPMPAVQGERLGAFHALPFPPDADLELSKELAQAVLEMARLPDNAPERVRMIEAVIDGIEASPKRAQKNERYRQLLYEFDRLNLSFAPEVLHLCSRVVKATGLDDNLVATATERLAMAYAFGLAVDTPAQRFQDTLAGRLMSIKPDSLKYDDDGKALFDPAQSVDHIGQGELAFNESNVANELYLNRVVRETAAAPAGTTCTEEQVETIKRIATSIDQHQGARLPVHLQYRLAQAHLFCGDTEAAERRFSQAVSPESDADMDRVRLYGYWAADNRAMRRPSVSDAVAQRMLDSYALLDEDKRTFKSDRLFQNSSFELLKSTLFALVSAGMHDYARQLSESAYKEICKLQRRRVECSGLALVHILTTQINVADGELAPQLATAIDGADAVTKREIVSVATFAARQALSRGDRATSRKLLAQAEAALASLGKAASVTVGNARVLDVAIGHACLGDWQSTIQRARNVRGTLMEPWLHWDRDPNELGLSGESQAFERAFTLSPLEAIIFQDPEAIKAWNKAGMPSLTHMAGQLRSISVSVRANALFLAGYPNQGLDLLRQHLPQFAKELEFLSDKKFLETVLSHLAKVDAAVLYRHGGLIDALSHTSLGHDGSTAQATLLRLHAAIAHAAGSSRAALDWLIAANAIDGRETQTQMQPSMQGEDIPGALTIAGQITRYMVEDLAAVTGKVPGRWAAVEQPLAAAHQALRRAQRPLLALLLVRHGSAIVADNRARQDLAFKIMQAATVSPTALELSTTLQRAGILDTALRDAQQTVQREEEERRERFQNIAPWWLQLGIERRLDIPRLCPGKIEKSSGPLLAAAIAQLPEAMAQYDAFPRIPTGNDTESTMKERVRAESAWKTLTTAQGGLVEFRSSPENLAGVTATLSPKKAILLAVTERDATYLALIAKNGMSIVEMTEAGRALGSAPVSAMVAEVRKRLDPSATFHIPSGGDALYHALFAPFKQQLGEIEELAIIARGPLEALPFSALAIKGATLTHPAPLWLDDRFVWSFAMAAGRLQPAADSTSVQRVIQLGPPEFSGGPECNRPIVMGDTANADLQHRMCSIDQLATLHESWPALPGTPGKKVLLTGKSATRQRITALGFGPAQNTDAVMIVATHGLLPSETAILVGVEEPAIVLMSNTSGGPREAVMLASDIARLNLHTQEVILAACNSASAAKYGDERAFSGLVRAFIRAGAERVVAAMAAVNSDTTQLALQFYFEERARGLDMAHAMSAARRRLRDADLTEPEYWAGLVAIGSY
ncbi:CHAT domain-containing protein [Duganella sp. FT80W]|uniref:CHAT domain-containing protein n=1 Tax=Duganella guangzhouensis TaxID=2666084 RepID=A0A6I2L0P9_9BURK|nr:CHAT domain-containing protein [Duganella guangzhouensis]MRW91412.1 CHAT domain-containing protein [Duganella guangzhouensis]